MVVSVHADNSMPLCVIDPPAVVGLYADSLMPHCIKETIQLCVDSMKTFPCFIMSLSPAVIDFFMQSHASLQYPVLPWLIFMRAAPCLVASVEPQVTGRH